MQSVKEIKKEIKRMVENGAGFWEVVWELEDQGFYPTNDCENYESSGEPYIYSYGDNLIIVGFRDYESNNSDVYIDIDLKSREYKVN